MIVLKCRECDGVNLKFDTHQVNYFQCEDCNFFDYLHNIKLEERYDNTVINLNATYWVSKDGLRFEISEMSKVYIRNVIRMLKRGYKSEELENSKLFQGLTTEYMLRD